MTKALLNLSGVSYRYPGANQAAVQDISLQPQRGEILGLLGPNGAGKSTLMALISGLRQPDSGTLERAPARFALVPQELAFYPMLTCLENLRFFAEVQGLRGSSLHARVDACMAIAQLQAAAHQRAALCSGGLKRRLNFAIGLLTDPDLLLLDEPTVGVDPQSRAHLLAAVSALRAQGKTLIYTSHYMEEVQAICDRVAIIDHGRVLVQGRLDELLAQKRPELSIRFVSPLPDQILAHWPTGFEVIATTGLDVRFRNQGELPWSSLLAFIEGQQLQYQQLHYGPRHLEDLFLHLTHRTLRD